MAAHSLVRVLDPPLTESSQPGAAARRRPMSPSARPSVHASVGQPLAWNSRDLDGAGVKQMPALRGGENCRAFLGFVLDTLVETVGLVVETLGLVLEALGFVGVLLCLVAQVLPSQYKMLPVSCLQHDRRPCASTPMDPSFEVSCVLKAI